MAMKDTSGGFVTIFPLPGDPEDVKIDGPTTINDVLAGTSKQFSATDFEVRVDNKPADGNTVVNPGAQVTLLQRVQGNADSALDATGLGKTFGSDAKPDTDGKPAASEQTGGAITVFPVPGDFEEVQVAGPLTVNELLARTRGQFRVEDFEVRVDNAKVDGTALVSPGQQVSLLQRVQGNGA